MSFDNFAREYTEIIDRVSRLSGETYRSIIDLRMSVLRDELGADYCGSAPLAVLDFGCGTGTTEICLRETLPRAVITGVDPSAESIRLAGLQQLEGVTFLHHDRARLPFDDGTFDLVYTNGTFHHIPAADRSTALAELARVLKPAGTICVFENNPLNPLTVRSMRQNPFDEGLRAVAPGELCRAAAPAGLLALPPRYYFFFPRSLRRLRPLERYLRRVPLGAQYLLRLKPTTAP